MFMLVLMDIFGGSLEITSENRNNFWGPKKSLKRFLGKVLAFLVIFLAFRHGRRTEQPKAKFDLWADESAPQELPRGLIFRGFRPFDQGQPTIRARKDQ